VYASWEECKAQVEGAEGALYMGFADEKAAWEAYARPPHEFIGKKAPAKAAAGTSSRQPVQDSLSVDAACSGNPGRMEYRGVDTMTGAELFRQGPFEMGTVNIGEFLAIVHALAFLKERKLAMPVYSDSRTAIKWVRDRKVNTKLERLPTNQRVFELIERALGWLRTHPYPNPILKWETAEWGEIPADFGRK